MHPGDAPLTLADPIVIQRGQVGVRPGVRPERVARGVEVADGLVVVVDALVVVALVKVVSAGTVSGGG